MATTVDELQVLITANAASFNKQLQAVQHQMDAMNNNTGKMGASMSVSFAKMAAKLAVVGIAIKKTFDIMAHSVRQFGDMEQNLGGVQAIYGKFADYLVDKSEKAYKTMGMSANQYLATANKIGAIMQGSGISQSQSLAMTTNWMQRAADVASVMGVSIETAMEAITGAAKGNFTMMDNIGVKMNAATLESYALSKGLKATYSEMDEGTKVGLMYQLFMEKTGYAAGNFAKEGATTLNGALATLKASFSNLATTLGRGLAPALTTIANFMNSYVIPAFQAAIPYVVGFMQAVGSAVGYVISALGSIFGFTAGGASEAESAMDGVAEVGAEASKSAGGIASGLGGATKAAKKLKGQLAGFDEMNVLQKPEDTSGGGGGGGGGAMPKFDLPKSAMNGLKKFGDEAEKVANRIKKAFDNVFRGFLKGFNFEKIGNAIKRFGNDIERFLAPAGKILGDLWNYLQPFIHWAGNDLLPAFLNAIGGALQFIGSVMGAIWDTALKPLIDLFLVPIAQFTGGVIVGVLNAIGDGLRWIAENEAAVDVVSALAISVASLTLVYNGYLFVSGLVKAAQLALNGAILAGTTASGAYAAGIGVVSAVQKAAAIATNIFSIALKALPFVGVVAGIATLVTAIILCIKHWDKIQKFVGEVVENIKRFIGNMVSAVGNFFAGLWSKICNIFGGIGSWFGQRFNEAKAAIHGAFSSVGRWASDRFNDIKNAFGNAFNVFSDIGKNIWNGLKNGIGNIGKKIGDMFSGAVNGVKNFLGIHSPSRVFAEIGKYIDSGLVMGIDADLSKVNGAMNRLTEGFSMPEINTRLNTSISPLANDKIESKAPEWAERLIKAIESNSDKHIEVKVDGAMLGEITAKSINDLSFLKNASIVDF